MSIIRKCHNHKLVNKPQHHEKETQNTKSHKAIGHYHEQTCRRGGEGANNKGADEPAHPNSLISAFVIRFWENILDKLATSEITSQYL